MSDTPRPFEHLPADPPNHFRLCFYAAVYGLVNHLRRLAQAGGEGLEVYFQRFPFLTGYFEEMRPYLPAGASWDETTAWWREAVTAWVTASRHHLPLAVLSGDEPVGFAGITALMLAGLVEEDSRFGGLFAALQPPLGQRRITVELVEQVLAGQAEAPWQTVRRLEQTGLLLVSPAEAPRAERTVQVPMPLWEVLRGGLPEAGPGFQVHPAAGFPALDELIFPPAFLDRLRGLPGLLRQGGLEGLVLRGSPGSDRWRVAGALAKALGCQAVMFIQPETAERAGLWAQAGPLCRLTGSLPVVLLDPGPGDSLPFPRLAGYHGPLLALMGLEGGLQRRELPDRPGGEAEQAVSLVLPAPDSGLRLRHWQAALPDQPPALLVEISEAFHFSSGYIRQAAGLARAGAALAGRTQLYLEDVREAGRAINRQQLDTLAAHLDGGGRWDELVVSPSAMTRLFEVEQRARHRERLAQRLGPGFGTTQARGVRVLFTGASGTGKTLAARILTAQLGKDLYRVDLAATVNKYIGETEKNLHRVLTAAEDLDVVLLLDEGDALLGSRTEVRSANDRYANLETNYLLQRLEHYQGIVIITTNAAQNIDSAFQRRMDVLVEFSLPGPLERYHIWQLHLPTDHQVDPAFLEEVALRCALTGGQIRSAALLAALLAVDGGGVLRTWHLEEAVQSEYRKAGATCQLDPPRHRGEVAAGMDDFLGALME